MEFLLFFVLMIGVLVLVLSRKRDGNSSDDSDVPERREENEETLRPLRFQTASTPQPFDAQTAKPQPENPVLAGPAYVVDGDTLVIRKTQIRLFGVDAPEMNHPFGKKAKWALVSLCKGQSVSAEITEKDDYGRTVARCYLPDGRDLSAEMVKLGLAIDWAKFSGGKYRDMEVPNVRKRLWLADARQKGRMHVWEQFDAKQATRSAKD